MNPLLSRALRSTWLALACVVLSNCGGSGDSTSADEQSSSLPRYGASCAGADVSSLKSIVYVSSKGADVAGCGVATVSPCQTIERGITNCAAAGCVVLVRHGLYKTNATITLRDGVSVYGSCRFDGEPDRSYRTTIDANPTPGTPALAATSVKTPTVVRGLVVLGKQESVAGSASLGVVVSRSSGLRLSDNVFAGGRGGDGHDGAQPAAPGADAAPGASGAAGGAGGASCTTGGGSKQGRGGQGGTDIMTAVYESFFNWRCTSTDHGSDGQPSGDGKPGGSRGAKGAHGLACGDRPHDYPGNGVPGKEGPSGDCGVAAQSSPLSGGSFQGTEWIASRGDDGRPGFIGAGGGGGGAGGACISETQGFIYTGLIGGGGGGGGCGGGSGTAAIQGGASIPLVLSDSAIAFDAAANTVIPGPGGRGGGGGDSVAGGNGGAGGAGRDGPQNVYLGHYCPGLSAKGGSGGPGGAGSAGAGGHGGPSIGIAVLGSTAAPSGAAAIYAARPGLGSRGGIGGGGSPPGAACSRTAAADGANGVTGLGTATFDFVAAPQNFLAGGQALAAGEHRNSLNGQYQLQVSAQNVMLTRGSDIVWRWSDTGLVQLQALRMQTDGNLCLHLEAQAPRCSNTSGHPGAYLSVEDDGHLVVVEGHAPLWTKPAL